MWLDSIVDNDASVSGVHGEGFHDSQRAIHFGYCCN